MLTLSRAAKKASDFLSNYEYYTAHPEEDKRIQQKVRDILSSPLLCSNTFDESTLFLGEKVIIIISTILLSRLFSELYK